MRALPAALLGATLLAGCQGLEPADRLPPLVRGPLPSRPQQAAGQALFHFVPRRARIQSEDGPRLEARAAYSSMSELRGNPAQDRVAFDGEILRASGSYRAALGEGSDFEIEVPVLYTSSGFLDEFVDDFHELLQLPDGGRDTRADDRWEMRLVKNGEQVFEVKEDALGVGDIPVVYTERILDELDDGWSLAWQLGFELPTGSESKGFGNGGLDVGGGFLAEKSFGRWTATGGVHYVDVADPSGFSGTGVEWSDLFDAQVGMECRWSRRLSLLSGLVWRSALTDDFRFEEIDREILDLGVGFAWQTGRRSILTFSFHEELVAASGADFSALLTWACGF